MSREDQIFELVDRWDTLNRQGQTISPEELCRDCPELLDPVRERIAKLRAINPALKTSDAPSSPRNPDEHKSGSAKPESGPRTLGRYQLQRLRGRGGFGEVWEAYDPQLKRQVAIKVRRSDRMVRSDVFEAEAQKVAQLHHPGIVGVYDFGYEGDTCFIVSQWVDGMNLAEWLKKRRPKPEQAARLVTSVADALEYAHAQGLIHRDVKPANILLDRQGRVLITDFGIAATQAQLAVEPFSGIGTTPYMTPEQIEGRGVRITPATDVYGLGVVLYELLTGRPPFIGDTYDQITKQIRYSPPQAVRTHNKKVPRELEAICLKALEKDPKDRYVTARDMADALRSTFPKSRTDTSPFAEQREDRLSPAALADKTSRRWRTVVIPLIAILAVVVGLSVWSLSHPGRDERSQKRTGVSAADVGSSASTSDHASTPKQSPGQPPGGSMGTPAVVSEPVDGARVAKNLVASQEDLNAVTELIRGCLNELPGRILRGRMNGELKPVSNSGQGVTLLRIPILIEIDQESYKSEVGAVISALDGLAVSRYESQAKLLKQQPMARDWKDTNGDSLQTSLSYNDKAKALTLTIDQQEGLEDSAVFPEPHLLTAVNWHGVGDGFRFGLGGNDSQIRVARQAVSASLDRVKEEGDRAGKVLTPVQIITDLSSAGTATFVTYGLEQSAVMSVADSFMAGFKVEVRLLSDDDNELESAQVAVRPTWRDDEDYRGFVVCLEQPDHRSPGFVGIWPGARNTWIGHQGACALSTSWRGHIYVEVATHSVQDITTAKFSIQWQPAIGAR